MNANRYDPWLLQSAVEDNDVGVIRQEITKPVQLKQKVYTIYTL